MVFGYPGGAIMPAYDALPAYPIRHVLVRHEQSAGHMADGYARATGRVGVAIATSGPGATNLVTAIATAMMDSIALVCITGQVPSALLGTSAFQEIDVIGITAPITKHNVLVKRAADIAPALREAFRIAKSGRPGPVLVDITKDAQQGGTFGEGPRTHRGKRAEARPLHTGCKCRAARANRTRAPHDARSRAAADPRGARRDLGRGQRPLARVRRANTHPGGDHAAGARRASRGPPQSPGHGGDAR